MSIMGEIRNLYIDREKTKVILPRTNTRAVSNDEGVGLEALLAEKADQAFVTRKIAEAQLGGEGGSIDLSDFATKDDLHDLVGDTPVSEQIAAAIAANGGSGNAGGGSGSVGGVTSWNDLTDKPFEETMGEVTLFEGNLLVDVDDSTGWASVDFEEKALEIGTVYNFTLDGTEYRDLVCFDDDGYPTIGAPYEEFNNGTSAIPFNVSSSFYAGQTETWAGIRGTEASHDIKLTKPGIVVKTLDEKYLPEGTVFRVVETEVFSDEGNVYSGNTDVNPVNGDYWFASPFRNAKDKAIVIIFNGTRYDVTPIYGGNARDGAVLVGGNLVSDSARRIREDYLNNITDYPTGEEYPFNFVAQNDDMDGTTMSVRLAENATEDVTVSIQIIRYLPSNVVDEICISDDIARKEFVEEKIGDVEALVTDDKSSPVAAINEVSNRIDSMLEPVVTTGVITYDGVKTGLASIGTFYKVADLMDNYEDMKFTSATFSTGSALNVANIIPEHGDGYIKHGYYIMLITADTISMSGTTMSGLTPGVYFMYSGTSYIKNAEYTVNSLALKKNHLQKLPAIPDLTAAPTMDDFNNLLAALRSAGYLAN